MVIFELSKHFETETKSPASFSAVVVNGPHRWLLGIFGPVTTMRGRGMQEPGGTVGAHLSPSSGSSAFNFEQTE